MIPADLGERVAWVVIGLGGLSILLSLATVLRYRPQHKKRKDDQ